jgi:hypothetical protein
MRVVADAEWAGTKEELLAKVQQFARQRDAHRLTVGQPAPFPEAPIIEELWKTGATPVLQKELPSDIPAGPAESAAVERARAVAYVLDQAIAAAAKAGDAPDYVLAEAARIAARKP